MRHDWTIDEIDQVKLMVADGMSREEIGVRMGMTKGSICGKARRLGLKHIRPPAKKKRKAAQVEAAVEITVQPASHEAVVVHEPWKPVFTRPVSIVRPVPIVMPPPIPIPVFVPPPKPAYIPRTHSCLYPTGDSPKIKFLCREPTPLGRSFCDKHSELVYVKTRRLEDAD